MAKLRPWLVIPVAGMLGAGAAVVATHDVALAIAIAVLAAALAAAIRAFGGPSLATAVTAAAGALLGVLGLLALGGASLRPVLGSAAGMFALFELVRVQLPGAGGGPLMGAAVVAAALDPIYVVLVVVAGVRLVAMPRSRPRWALALPVIGVLATVFAIVACVSRGGLATAWIDWSGRAHHATIGARGALAALDRAGDLLGPLAATTAIAGLALATTRGRLAAAAIAGCAAMIALEAFGGGGDAARVASPLPPALPILAAFGAGVAMHRFAALIRAPIGQTCVAATAGFVLVVVPAWTLLL